MAIVKEGTEHWAGVSEAYLARKVDFNGLDANILGSRCHVGR